MRRIKAGIAAVAVCAALFSHVVNAQGEATPQDEYSKRLKAYQTISPGGETPFGERINLYTGELSFGQTDIAYEGIGPTIVLARTTLTSQQDKSTEPPAFGSWDLSIPRIETLVGIGQVDTQWGASANNYARCTNFDPPPSIGYTDSWHGMEFIAEDGERRPLLKRDTANYTNKPAMTVNGQSVTFTGVTLDNWQFGCLDSTDNLAITGTAAVGESFLAVSPQGTKYWLNYLVSRPASQVRETDPVGGEFVTRRQFATMYVTRIEDRFGNSLVFTYSGKQLTHISASDGREIDIAWRVDAPLVQTITQQPGISPARVWNYQYANVTSNPILTTVELPDDSEWTFSGPVGIDGSPSDSYLTECTTRDATLFASPAPPLTTTITAPSGVVGTFQTATVWHARSYVPSDCTNLNGTAPFHETIPPVFGTYALTQRTMSGPGMVAQTWTYEYSPAAGSALRDTCASSSTCNETAYVDIKDPASNYTRQTYSTRSGASSGGWVADEGKLLQTDVHPGPTTTTPLRTTTYRYAAPDRGPFPSHIGFSLNAGSFNTAKLEAWTPIDRTQITQQGETFTSEVAAGTAGFDAFARRINVTNSNTLGHARTQTTTYHDNVAKWALAQVASSAIDGISVSQTVFDTATDLPKQVFSYGKTTPDQTYTYNANGTVNTVADGNGNVSTLSGWKRGIPQSILFPATPEALGGATISAQVNDLGQIDWTKDPFNNQTCYTYDSMGRLVTITYPAETGVSAGTCLDNTPWEMTTRAFIQIANSEYGIATNHWRETITTGNNEKITYFDALWRPLVVRERDTSQSSTTRFGGYAYDTRGYKVFDAYPSAAANATSGIFTTYDALGRVTQVEQDWEGAGMLTTSTAYQADFKTQVTNPRGKVTTTTSYQAWDRPSTDLPLEITHPEGMFTSIGRDRFGKPTALTRHDAGSTTVTRTLVYDGTTQELCKRIEPETGTNVMHYDAAGNIDWTASAQNGLSTTNCGDVNSVPTTARVTRSYDARNRLQALVFPDINGSQSWSYTADGLPAQVDTLNEDGNTTVTNTYSYNRRRSLTGESQSQPGIGGLSLGYVYNANGVLATIDYPGTGPVDYAPNALGQPTKAGSYATGVSYYPNGGMSGFTYGNGIVHTMTQNARQLPEQSIDSGGVLNDSYDYDQNGNVLAISDGLAGNRGNRTMTYDNADRLTAVTSPIFTGGTVYGYDVLDNLIHVKAPGRDHYYCYDANWQLTNIKTSSCSGSTVVGLGYDNQGNLLIKNGLPYQFDLGNRLRLAEGKERYRYDGHGRRVASIAELAAATQGTIYSFYGQDGVLHYQRDERQGKATSYIMLNGSLVAGVSDPVPPTGVGLSVPADNNTGAYTVSWTQAGSATSYPLQEKVGTGSWTTVQSTSAISRALTGKPVGTYHYRAQACNVAGCSPWSNTGTIVVTPPPPTLSVPSQTTAQDLYSASWTSVSGASNYRLDEEALQNSQWVWNEIRNTTVTNAQLTRGAGTYRYRVRACDAAGCGAYSNVGSIVVTSGGITPPEEQ